QLWMPVAHNGDRAVCRTVIKSDKHLKIPMPVKKGRDFSEMSSRRQLEYESKALRAIAPAFATLSTPRPRILTL
ncbi:hypothetical protein SEE13_016660, partial [Salmonella enterica subsp. enterica serovar Enteritidis str. 13-1]